MALERLCLSLVLLAVVVVCADQPQPQALRSFNDRQDKFNGNYEPLDSVQHPSRGRVATYSTVASSDESYVRPSRARTSPSVSNNRYSSYTDETIHRFGDVAATHEAPLTSFPAIDRKTFSAGGKTGNLALVVTPLAGIAFIAAAAAVAISPVYLTLSSSLFGRKKRDLLSMMDPSVSQKLTPDMVKKVHELQTLEKFLASVPKENDYQQQIMSMYLSCSGYTQEDNFCLDRVFCEYGNTESNMSEDERDVLSIVMYNIMSNSFVPDEYKQRLRTAARVGRDFNQCGSYNCPALNSGQYKSA